MINILVNFIRELRMFLSKKLKYYNVTFPYIIALLLALLFVVFGINAFVELTEVLSTETLASYDTQITNFVLSHRTSALTHYFTFITHVGDVYGYLVVLILTAIISLIVFKRKKYMLQIIAVLVLSAFSNLVLKRVINRARPDIEHLVAVETLSYPSGHAMSAMAFYGFLIYLCYTFKMNKFLKFCAILILILLILSIGASRIYLGVHFPSDILGGFIAGAIWVVFCIIVFNLIEVFRRDPKTSNNI